MTTLSVHLGTMSLNHFYHDMLSAYDIISDILMHNTFFGMLMHTLSLTSQCISDIFLTADIDRLYIALNALLYKSF